MQMEEIAERNYSVENIIRAAVDQIQAAGAERLPPQESDYLGENGLLYCGRCHEPKQVLAEMPWGIIRPYIPCRCELEREAQKAAAADQRQRAERVARYRAEAFSDKALADFRFTAAADEQDKYLLAAKRYAAHFAEFREAGKGLLLYGGTGVGKTFLAACISNELLDHGYRARMTNVRRIANELFGLAEKQEYIDKLSRYDLLVLDDLAAERATDYVAEITYTIINARCLSGLPLVVTTTRTVEEMKHPPTPAAERIYSRILEMCHPIKMEGPDRRRLRAAGEYQAINHLLGL